MTNENLKTIQKRDIEKYSHDYLNSKFESVMVYYRRKKVLEFLNKYNPQRVLEIGSGIQSIFDFYTDYKKFTVVEPSSVFCESVKKSKFYNNRVNIINDFFENKIEILKQQKYDFIILSSLLHEIQNPVEFLKNIYELCDDKTILHVNVPNSESFHLLWAYKSGLIKRIGDLTQTAIHLQKNSIYNLITLESFIESCGFCVLEKGSFFIKPFNHTKMFDCVEKNIIDSELLNGLYDLTDYFPNNGAEIFVNCKVCPNG